MCPSQIINHLHFISQPERMRLRSNQQDRRRNHLSYRNGIIHVYKEAHYVARSNAIEISRKVYYPPISQETWRNSLSLSKPVYRYIYAVILLLLLMRNL